MSNVASILSKGTGKPVMDGDSPVAWDGGLAHGACNNSCLCPLFNGGVACAEYQGDGVKTDS